jgi:hypothetical protein
MTMLNIEEKTQRIITAYQNENITRLEAKQLLSELRMDSLAVLLGIRPAAKDDNGNEQS